MRLRNLVELSLINRRLFSCSSFEVSTTRIQRDRRENDED